MKLYVCWGTFQVPGMREHPCRIAYEALVQADYEPEVIKTHGWGALPRALQTPGRKTVEDGTGESWVPALQTDDGEWISGTSEIVAWAEQHAEV
ncbi:MAG: glutathione S-transferase domain-containing protein [Solirubrobacterales bacterium]|nr:glutathione S-transferase domain-containing protein [Solirubrobacterales bacterium]